MKKWGIMGDCNEKMLNKGRSGRQFMILVLVALACVSSGCRKQEARVSGFYGVRRDRTAG